MVFCFRNKTNVDIPLLTHTPTMGARKPQLFHRNGSTKTTCCVPKTKLPLAKHIRTRMNLGLLLRSPFANLMVRMISSFKDVSRLHSYRYRNFLGLNFPDFSLRSNIFHEDFQNGKKWYSKASQIFWNVLLYVPGLKRTPKTHS